MPTGFAIALYNAGELALVTKAGNLNYGWNKNCIHTDIKNANKAIKKAVKKEVREGGEGTEDDITIFKYDVDGVEMPDISMPGEEINWKNLFMKTHAVTEEVEITLDGKKYLLEKGDKVVIEHGTYDDDTEYWEREPLRKRMYEAVDEFLDGTPDHLEIPMTVVEAFRYLTEQISEI